VKRAARPRRESRPLPSPPPGDDASLADASLALSVWVRLLRAHGLILRALRPRLPAELTLPQFDVLAQLDRHPDGLTPGALTRALLVTAGNVTGIVRRLEGQGLVERVPVPEDRRTVRVRLTERGRRRIGQLLPAHARHVEEVLQETPSADLAELRSRLGALLGHLEAS